MIPISTTPAIDTPMATLVPVGKLVPVEVGGLEVELAAELVAEEEAVVVAFKAESGLAEVPVAIAAGVWPGQQKEF